MALSGGSNDRFSDCHQWSPVTPMSLGSNDVEEGAQRGFSPFRTLDVYLGRGPQQIGKMSPRVTTHLILFTLSP